MLKSFREKQSGWINLTPVNGFGGWHTKFDPSSSQSKGRLVAGQNVKITDGKIVTRDGSQRIGFLDYSVDAPARVFTYKKTDGKEILMRARGTLLEWFHPDLDEDGATSVDEWDVLETGFTAESSDGLGKMRFAVNTILDEDALTSSIQYVFFCNAIEAQFRWTGAYARYGSSTASTIVVGGSTSLSDLGFTATGSVVIDGIDYAYTGLSSQTFTGVTPDPTTGGHTNGEPLAQVPLSVSAAPRGNLLLSRDSRMIVAGIKYNSSGTLTPRESVVGGSQIGDATNWTISATRTDGQAFFYSLSGGGPVTGLAQDELAIYLFQSSLIQTMEFVSTTAVTAMNDLVRVKPLKAHDGRSHTVGCISPDTIAASPNGILFVTQDKKVGYLTRKENTDYPQILSISDGIQPSLNASVFDEAAAIVYKDQYLLAAKKDVNSTANDVVYVYDLNRNEWHPPYISWNVSNWAIKGGKLYWGDSYTPNVWKMVDERTDDTAALISLFRTWQEDFGDPITQKTADMVYVEYNGNVVADMVFTLLLNEDGYTKRYKVTVLGSSTQYVFNSSILNTFGASVFATQVFGTNAANANLKKRRVYLDFLSNVEFYNISLEGGSSKEGANYEFIKWGVHIVESKIETPKKLRKVLSS